MEQAKGVPGTAVVQLTYNRTFERSTYYLNFDVPVVSDEFNSAVGKQWQWIRENKAMYSLAKKEGALTITSETGDVSEASNNAKNILLQSAKSDWVAETKLAASRNRSQFEHAGLLAYQDDDDFVNLMLRAVVNTRPSRGAITPASIDLVVEENGIAKSVGSFNVAEPATGNKNVQLKLAKQGNVYTAYYAVNGGAFVKLATANGMLNEVKAGLIVCGGVIIQSMKNVFYFESDTTKPGAPFDLTFDYFHRTSQ